MQASLITLPHLTMSDLIVAASSAGELLPTVSIPELKCRPFTSGRFSTRTISWFSRLTSVSGVLVGASKGWAVAAPAARSTTDTRYSDGSPDRLDFAILREMAGVIGLCRSDSGRRREPRCGETE